MQDNTRQYDFDLHRRGLRLRRQRQRAAAQRKGLSRRGDGDGPPLDAREPAEHQLVAESLVLAAQPGAARLLQHALFPPRDHPARLRRRRRLHHLCLHHAASAGQSVGQRDRGTAWPIGSRRCRSTTTPRRACSGVIENRILGPADKSAAAGRRRRSALADTFLSHQRRDLSVARRRARRYDRARSVLRRRRSGAHHLPGLRRLHDGLPSRRQEHAGPELSLSRREARSARSSPRPGSSMFVRSTASPTAARDTKFAP